ncbi:MAG: sensor histidine kinase [Gammaproteobacteria bacterium]
MKNASLKFRVILALVLIVTVTSALFSGGVLLIKAQLEEVIFGNMVADQLEDIKQLLDEERFDESQLFAGWDFYLSDNESVIAPELTQLAPGSHHTVVVDDKVYQVEVGQWQSQPVYLTYDITEWEEQEHTVLIMLVYGLVIVLFVSLLMGWTATRAILAPVRRLSSRLTKLQPGVRSKAISQDYEGTEIGEIAAAFDKYMERLDQFVEREQTFTAAASHELRTPLSVMMGAVDVLSDNTQSAISLRAIARIKRACNEMLAFIEATLYLSREGSTQIDQGSPADLAVVVERLLEDNASAIEAKSIRIEKRILGTPVLTQPLSLVQITMGNILRNAIQHTDHGVITIEIEGDRISFIDTGEGIPAENLSQVFERSYSTKSDGTGLGLNLVKRICDRFNWGIEIESEVGVGTSVCVAFSSLKPL